MAKHTVADMDIQWLKSQTGDQWDDNTITTTTTGQWAGNGTWQIPLQPYYEPPQQDELKQRQILQEFIRQADETRTVQRRKVEELRVLGLALFDQLVKDFDGEIQVTAGQWQLLQAAFQAAFGEAFQGKWYGRTFVNVGGLQKLLTFKGTPLIFNQGQDEKIYFTQQPPYWLT